MVYWIKGKTRGYEEDRHPQRYSFGYWDPKYLHYFGEPCDEYKYAGDIGTVEVAERLAEFRPFRAVCGNCDGGDLRLMYRELNRFKCEEVDVLIKHIGGYPGTIDG